MLEVGDRIRIKNWAVDMTVEIGRVTKTKAISKPFNDAGATMQFKIGYDNPERIHHIPKERYSVTEYSLIDKNNQKQDDRKNN